MTAASATVSRPVAVIHRRVMRPRRVALYAFLTFTVVTWLFPLLWAVYTALRPYSDTAHNGYISLPGVLNFDNFVNAWNQAELPQFYLNSLIVTVPAVILSFCSISDGTRSGSLIVVVADRTTLRMAAVI